MGKRYRTGLFVWHIKFFVFCFFWFCFNVLPHLWKSGDFHTKPGFLASRNVERLSTFATMWHAILGIVVNVPFRHGVSSPACYAPHHSLLSLSHLLLSFTLNGFSGKLRPNIEAEILRLGRKHAERHENRDYNAMCGRVYAHACMCCLS